VCRDQGFAKNEVFLERFEEKVDDGVFANRLGYIIRITYVSKKKKEKSELIEEELEG